MVKKICPVDFARWVGHKLGGSNRFREELRYSTLDYYLKQLILKCIVTVIVKLK